MSAKVALSALLCAFTQVGVAQEPREMFVVVKRHDPSQGEAEGIYIEYDLPRRGPAQQQDANAPQRAKVVRPHPAMHVLASGEQTIKAGVIFHEEVGGALGDDQPSKPATVGVSLVFIDPKVEVVSGKVQSTPAGAMLNDQRLDGDNSILLLAAAQDRPVELEGWRFTSGQPFLVAAVKGVVLKDEGRRARGLSDGYLSVAVPQDGEFAFQKTKDVQAGEGLWISRLSLHRRGDFTAPFRSINELDLAHLDYDAKDEGGEDSEMDVMMVFTRPSADAYGKTAPAGFIPLRRLDLGSPEAQKRVAGELATVDTSGPQQGLLQKVAPKVR